jgi:dipeptidyl aminopeptidase/acylaminoacyl peptidase
MNDELPIHKRRVVYQVPGINSVSVQRDIVYKSEEATDLKLDVYAPKGLSNSARLPGIVFIHGGPLPPPLQLQMKEENYAPFDFANHAQGHHAFDIFRQ